MDRLARLRLLVERALDELALPNSLSHEQYAVVATLHEIALEVAALRAERARSASDFDERVDE